MDQSKLLTICIALAKTEATIHPEKFRKILNTASTTVYMLSKLGNILLHGYPKYIDL